MNDYDKEVDKVSSLLKMTTEIVSSFLNNNVIDVNEVPKFINETYLALKAIDGGIVKSSNPAIPVRKSITPDFLVCLEDGKKLKMLKRYLRTYYNLSPEEYKRKWDLPSDYPMVAPNYAKKRSEFAKKAGFGKNLNEK